MLVTKKYLKEVVEGMDIIVNELPVSIKNDIQGEMGIVLEDVGFSIQKNKDDIFDLQGSLVDLEGVVEEKVYSIEDDLDEVKTLAEDIDDKLSYYDLDDMQSSVSNMEYEFESMEDKVNELESQVEELQDEVNELNAELNELKVLVKTLMNKVNLEG